MAWQYDSSSRRYRGPDGRFLSQQQMVGLRDRFTDSMKALAADLAQQRSEGTLPQNAWEREMRSLIKATYVDLGSLGRGGRRQMAPADWGRVGSLIRRQYEFLGRFADDTRNLSEAQIRARAGLYVESATAAYERGRAAAWQVDLPQHPGDGSTACGSNCRCHWQLEETETGEVLATWVVNAGAESCADCLANAATWNPLRISARTDGGYKHLAGRHDQQTHGHGRGGGSAGGGDDHHGKVSAEHREAIDFAHKKIAAAPVPTKEEVTKARAELAAAKLDKSKRPGGEARGGSAADRRKQRENLFREMGGDKRGHVCCHGCGSRMHHAEPGSPANPKGYQRFERGKIFVKAQGGGYRMPNLLAECFGCNRSRNDTPMRPENLD